jgi:NAD(P)-dependent dehydrogenase (short-subunit alcohol dehydrogenase family)
LLTGAAGEIGSGGRGTMPDAARLEDAVIAVTGGARGIGRATAAALTRAGARVAIGDLHLELAETTAGEIGGDIVSLPLDVTDRRSFARFLDDTEAKLGPLTGLVNNAGLMGVGPLVEEDDSLTDRQIAVNLAGVILGAKLAVPRMLAHGRGHLVNLASAAGRAGIAGAATYCATKHAVVGFTEAMRSELASTPVEVSMVLPGLVDTELTRGFPDRRGVRRVGPEEVAEAIVGVLRRPRLAVYVPRSVGVGIRVMGAIPRPLRDRVGRALGVDDYLLTRVDQDERAGYVARTTGGEPARH